MRYILFPNIMLQHFPSTVFSLCPTVLHIIYNLYLFNDRHRDFSSARAFEMLSA